MEDATLRLLRRKDCFIAIPGHFVFKRDPFHGIMVSIISVSDENKQQKKICVSWDGKSTTWDNSIEIDSDFATANGFQNNEKVLFQQDFNIPYCNSFSIDPIDKDEYEMLDAKAAIIEANLLSAIKFIHKDLIIPIWLSANVRVLTRVVSVNPDCGIVALTNRTELQIIGAIQPDDVLDNCLSSESPIADIELAFLDVALGFRLDGNKDLQYNPMLVCGPKGSGKTYFLNKVKAHYTKKVAGLLCLCKDMCDSKPDSVKRHLLSLAKRAVEKQPALFFIENIDLLVAYNPLHDGQKGFEKAKLDCYVDAFCQLVKYLERETKDNSAYNGNLSTPKVAIIMTSSASYKTLHPRLIESINGSRKFFSFIKVISEPNSDKRKQIFMDILKQEKIVLDTNQHEIEDIVRKTESYTPLDIRQIIQSALVSEKVVSKFAANKQEMPVLNGQDILKCIETYTPINLRATKLQPKSSKNLSSIGGMCNAKKLLTRIILLPLRYPDLIKQAPIRMQTHVLLHGPSGCGKTSLAEAIANEQNMNFFAVRGPELFSKYIGGSEAAIRDLFERAESAAPCIILFDEFDSIAPQRGHDSTGVTDRVVNQLLTILDGAQRLKQGVHIIATTSRRDMIDPALLRPGRLDCHILCDYPNCDERLEILEVLGKDIEFANDVDKKLWNEKLDHFSGADIRSFLYTAQLKALHSVLESSKLKSQEEKKDISIKVNTANLETSYEEILEGVEKRFTRNKKQNKNFQSLSCVRQISARATLA